MRSYLLPPGYRGEDCVEISGPDHRYLTRVLRVRVGDRFEATDGRGKRYALQVREVGTRRLVAGVEERRESGQGPQAGPAEAQPAHVFDLLQCLPKGHRMDLIVRQATESGVRRIVPLLSRYTVPRLEDPQEALRKVRRWERIAREALRQSGRLCLPQILPPVRLETFLDGEIRGTGIFLHQEPLGGGSLHGLLAGAQREVLLLVGPEGGLSGEEAQKLLARGFHPAHIGGTVLRTETAALFALAAARIIVEERDCWKLAR